MSAKGSTAIGKSSSTTTTYWSVYMKPKYAFDHDGIQFWGTAKQNLDDINLLDTDLIINCTGTAYVYKPFVAKMPSWLKLPSSPEKHPDQLLLEWKDNQPPPEAIEIDFWSEIINQSKKHGIKRIICCCIAGQGRTGTALAALALSSGFIKEPGDAIDYIREHYSDKSIETKSQEYYVWSLIYDDPDVFDDKYTPVVPAYNSKTAIVQLGGKEPFVVDPDEMDIEGWLNRYTLD